ncbi:unnamed protein product [Blepharisma stoltei]|uniref:Uncharacterized protein n=1 Tax=Blepharisma stoltei TaxID=1481888 RepID=A0AAU9JBI2_9CILI|nr:unnamed protein product [Blepharisma stoltei]
MEECLARQRRPLSQLIDSNQGELSKLLNKFDMCREIVSRNLIDAVKYAYIEHLMRISTPSSESRKVIQTFPKNQQAKLMPLLENRNENLQDSLHNLEEIVTNQDLNPIHPIIKSTNYRWDGRRLLAEELDYQSEGLTPICFTLSINQNNYILYTPNMTYVDGFDPFTGEKNIPIIPDDMLRVYSKGFFVLSNIRSTQSQTDFEEMPRKKKKNAELSKKSTEENERPSLIKEASGVGFNKNPFKIQEAQTKFDEVTLEISKTPTKPQEAFEETEMEEVSIDLLPEKTKPSLLNLEEIGTNSEEEESEEESDEDEGITTFPTNELRTWEKYDKQAAKKQRSRDQCAPIDGCTIS